MRTTHLKVLTKFSTKVYEFEIKSTTKDSYKLDDIKLKIIINKSDQKSVFMFPLVNIVKIEYIEIDA